MTDPFVDAVVKALDLDLPDEVRNLLINLSNERVGYLERLRLVQRVAVGEMDNLLNVEQVHQIEPSDEDPDRVTAVQVALLTKNGSYTDQQVAEIVEGGATVEGTEPPLPAEEAPENLSASDPLPSPSPQGDPENAAESSPNSKEGAS